MTFPLVENVRLQSRENPSNLKRPVLLPCSVCCVLAGDLVALVPIGVIGDFLTSDLIDPWRLTDFGLFCWKTRVCSAAQITSRASAMWDATQIAMLEARQDARVRYKDFLVVLHVEAGFAPHGG